MTHYVNKGRVLLKNEMQYPFNNSAMLIELEHEMPDCEYRVCTEIVSSEGDAGEIVVTEKALNGFVIAFSGSAVLVDVQYTVSGPEGKEAYTNVEYVLNETCLSLRDGEITLDLARYERDYPVCLRIGENAFGMLVMGDIHRYLMQVMIPARRYTYETGAVDDIGLPRLYKIPVPFDINRVGIKLFGREAQYGKI